MLYVLASPQRFDHRNIAAVGCFGVGITRRKAKDDMHHTERSARIVSNADCAPSGILLDAPFLYAFGPRFSRRRRTGYDTVGHEALHRGAGRIEWRSDSQLEIRLTAIAFLPRTEAPCPADRSGSHDRIRVLEGQNVMASRG